MEYEIIQIDGQTWRIEDHGVRFFLLTGMEKALLIDSGMMVHNAKEIAQTLTDLPVELLNTHADIDHIGSNHQFDTVYMNPAEASNYYKTQRERMDRSVRLAEIRPVWDGDVIDLGDRPLDIIALPGHTPGSIAVLDRVNGVLLSGDPIQDGEIFMFGIQRELHAYIHSLKRLKDFGEWFDVIYPSHGSFPVKPELIDALIEGGEKVLRGEIKGESGDFHGMPLRIMDVGAARFLYDPEISD